MSRPYANHPENHLTSYLRNLHRYKSTLAHGQLVCVSASSNITTMAALFRLASAVGPFIAVLQVHADIIDDWSLPATRRLTYLAKKFGFLVWEGGRVLNPQRRSGRTQSMSYEEITNSIDMARKRYTKGVVNVAAWAGLSSTWVIGSEEHGRGADRLIPILRRAAKERVALMTTLVRTEISAGEAALEALNGTVGDDSEDSGNDHETGDKDECSPWPVVDGPDMALNFRKPSVISLTHTITQHTELSTPRSATKEEEDCCSDEEYDYELEATATATPVSLAPPPPLLSRGVIVCLPTEHETRLSPPYKDAAIAAAKEHSDFVAGFVTDEAWVDVCRHRRFESDLQDQGCDENAILKEYNEENTLTGVPESQKTFVVFSPLENGHVSRCNDEEHDSTAIDQSISLSAENSPPSQQGSPTSTHSPQISSLHELVARAVAIRDASVSTDGNASCRQGAEILYIPVISMNA